MAFIALVSIGQFAPGDAVTGIDEARISELLHSGYLEDIGLTVEELAEIAAEEAKQTAEAEHEKQLLEIQEQQEQARFLGEAEAKVKEEEKQAAAAAAAKAEKAAKAKELKEAAAKAQEANSQPAGKE